MSKFHPDYYSLPLKDAVDLVKSLRSMNIVQAVREFRLWAKSLYTIGYAAGQADANAAQQAKSKASPFAMQEIAPGMFAMTLDNPEQLFALLDMLSGDLPFSPKANDIVAKEASEMCVVYEPAECDPNCTSHDCHYMHREAWTVFRGKDRLASYPSEQEAKDAIRRHGSPYFV